MYSVRSITADPDTAGIVLADLLAMVEVSY